MDEKPTPPKEEKERPLIRTLEDAQNEYPELVVLPNQPRPARDMKDLLRYAMDATTAMPAPQSSTDFQPMDVERQKFLEDAMKSMTVDLIQVINKALDTLKGVKDLKADDDPEEYEEAMETITDIVNNVDVANDFHKVGGFEVLLPCLTTPHISLQWRTAELIAELCQNNPYCQSHILSAGLLPVLLDMVDNGSSESVKVKALYAISCLVRDSTEGLENFSKRDGFSVLLRAMQSDVEKLKIKSAFLLSALCSQHPAIRDDLQKMGWVHQLAGLISEERTPSHEHLLSGLLALVQNHDKCIEDGRDPKLQLRSLLSSHIDLVKGKAEFQEEEEYAKRIISIVFSDDEAGGEER